MIRIKLSRKTSDKVKKRLKNKARIRKKVLGTPERPRLAVFRSGRHIYAQLVDDTHGSTLAAASTLGGAAKGKKNLEASKAVGAELAKVALGKNIKSVVFDRSGYVYHGRIKALAEGAREAGLDF
jgi:large subunit ribosomal protein L18